MYAKKFSRLNLPISVILLFWSSFVSALEIDPGVGAGLRYTDNAALTPDNEDDDWIVGGYLGAQIKQNTGPVTANATASLNYEKYTDDTFGDQYYFNLNAGAGWDIIKDRFDWQVVDYFTTIRRNSLDSNTPDNQQNANAFSTGPNIRFPVSPRNSAVVSPVFRDFYYENSDADNQQYELGALWSYRLNRTMDLGPNVRVTKIDYENDDRNPDVTIGYLGIAANGTRPRSVYTINLGGNYVRRDDFDNVDGFAGDVDWRYNLTGRSSLRAYALTSLTDASADFLRSENDPDTGDFMNEQISSDVLRNSTARLTYQRGGTTLDSTVWLEYRDLDYKEAPNDREVKVIGGTLGYSVTPLMRTGITGRYNNTKETDTNRTDKEYIVGGNVSYSLSRKLRTSFRIGYHKKDSTSANNEFNEFSASINLVYGFQAAAALPGGDGRH